MLSTPRIMSVSIYFADKIYVFDILYRLLVSVDPFGYDWFQLPVVLVLYLLQYQRSFCRWLVLKIAIHLLEALLAPLATSPKPPTLQLQQLTPTWHQTSGRKLFSPNLHTKNSATTCRRIIVQWPWTDKKSNSIKYLILIVTSPRNIRIMKQHSPCTHENL